MNKQTQPLALRMDDVGASSKKYEVYSNKILRLGPANISGNWLFLKSMPAFKAWGPYRELNAEEWQQIFGLLQEFDAKLTVGVTAAWAEGQKQLVPFPERFPAQAKALREGLEQGLIEIANHGLTHCVLENNAFKPKLFRGNREFHREFGPSVSVEIQEDHLQRSQEILQDWLGVEVVTFVPPGNLFTEDTLRLARKYGLRFVSCDAEPSNNSQPIVLGNKDTLTFHDREIILEGLGWLRKRLEAQTGKYLCFVRDLALETVAA